MRWLSSIAVALILMGLTGFAMWFFFFNSSDSTYNPAKVVIPAGMTAPPPRSVPPGESEYRNIFYRMSLLYPNNMKVTEQKGAGTTLTVLFEEPSTGNTFQIYVLPYGEPQISKERFLEDEPSGVMASSTVMNIDGVSAGAFYGQDATVGPTREVWFIKNGFLYEAATAAELQPWFDPIIQSWQFL